MASVNGATCAMCIKSPAMLAKCSPGADYQQRIGCFKIKRPFSLRIDIDQKEWPRLTFAQHLGSGAEPVSDMSHSTSPTKCRMSRRNSSRTPQKKRMLHYHRQKTRQ